MVQNITQNWSQRDRGDAVDWAAGLTNPDEQAAAYQSISSDWMQEDSYKASEWISKLAAGKPRDAAVVSMAQQIAATDPDLSWKWSLTMTDPELRAQALGNTFQAWTGKDAAAAQSALSDPGLSEADRAAIITAQQNPKPQVRRTGSRVIFSE